MNNNWWSKVYRTFASVLPVSKGRHGSCVNCGECCKLPKKCLFLRHKNGKSRCLIYALSPLNCRKYPLNEKTHLTKNICGFRFKKLTEVNANSE